MDEAPTIVNSILRESDPDAPEQYVDWLKAKTEKDERDAALREQELADIAIGFAIHTTDEEMMRANALEDGIDIEDQAVGDQITRDYGQLERNALRLMRACGFNAHDQGHDSDGALVGNCWLTSPEALATLKRIIDGPDEMPSTTSGTFNGAFPGSDVALWVNVSEIGRQLLDVRVEFFDLDKLKEWLEAQPVTESIDADAPENTNWLAKASAQPCRNCSADLTQPSSVIRNYIHKESGEAYPIAGHYVADDGSFDYDEDMSSELAANIDRCDLSANSDVCAKCMNDPNVPKVMESADEDDPDLFMQSYVPRMLGSLWIDYKVVAPSFPSMPILDTNFRRENIDGLPLFRYKNGSEMLEIMRQMKAYNRQRGEPRNQMTTYRYQVPSPTRDAVVRTFLESIPLGAERMDALEKTNAPIWFYVSVKEFNAYVHMVFPKLKISESVDNEDDIDPKAYLNSIHDLDDLKSEIQNYGLAVATVASWGRWYILRGFSYWRTYTAEGSGTHVDVDDKFVRLQIATCMQKAGITNYKLNVDHKTNPWDVRFELMIPKYAVNVPEWAIVSQQAQEVDPHAGEVVDESAGEDDPALNIPRHTDSIVQAEHQKALALKQICQNVHDDFVSRADSDPEMNARRADELAGEVAGEWAAKYGWTEEMDEHDALMATAYKVSSEMFSGDWGADEEPEPDPGEFLPESAGEDDPAINVARHMDGTLAAKVKATIDSATRDFYKECEQHMRRKDLIACDMGYKWNRIAGFDETTAEAKAVRAALYKTAGYEFPNWSTTTETAELIRGIDLVKRLLQIGTAQGGFLNFTLKEVRQRDFRMDTVDVRELMKTDHDFHGYAENYSPRSYEDGGLKPTDGSDIELEPQDLYGEPIVVIDGCVRDGWSRAAAHFKAGDFMVQAWVALPPVLKEASNPDDVDIKAYADTVFDVNTIMSEFRFEKSKNAWYKVYRACLNEKDGKNDVMAEVSPRGGYTGLDAIFDVTLYSSGNKEWNPFDYSYGFSTLDLRDFLLRTEQSIKSGALGESVECQPLNEAEDDVDVQRYVDEIKPWPGTPEELDVMAANDDVLKRYRAECESAWVDFAGTCFKADGSRSDETDETYSFKVTICFVDYDTDSELRDSASTVELSGGIYMYTNGSGWVDEGTNYDEPIPVEAAAACMADLNIFLDRFKQVVGYDLRPKLLPKMNNLPAGALRESSIWSGVVQSLVDSGRISARAAERYNIAATEESDSALAAKLYGDPPVEESGPDEIDPREYALSLPVFDPKLVTDVFNKRYDGARCAKLDPLNTLSEWALGWYPPRGLTDKELEDLRDVMEINGIALLKEIVPSAYDVWFATNRGVYPYVIYFRLPKGTRDLGESADPDEVNPKDYALSLPCFDPKQLAFSMEIAGWGDARCYRDGDAFKLGFDNPNPNIRDADEEFYAAESDRARAAAEETLGTQCPEAEILDYYDHGGYNDYELYFSLPPGVHALTDHKPAPVRESADPDDVDPLDYADATFDIDTVMAKLGFEKQAKSWRKIYAATPPLNHEWMIGVKPTRDVNLGACFDATMYSGAGPSWSEFWSQYWLSAVALPSVIQQFEQHMDGSPILSESAEPLPDVDDPATVLKNNAVDLLTNELTRLGFESSSASTVELGGGGNTSCRWVKKYSAPDSEKHGIHLTIYGDGSLRFYHWNPFVRGWDSRTLECTSPSPAYSANVIRDMDAAMQRCVADSLPPDPEHTALKRVVDHYAQQRMEWLKQNVNFGGEEGDIGTEQMRLERMIQRNR